MPSARSFTLFVISLLPRQVTIHLCGVKGDFIVSSLFLVAYLYLLPTVFLGIFCLMARQNRKQDQYDNRKSDRIDTTRA